MSYLVFPFWGHHLAGDSSLFKYAGTPTEAKIVRNFVQSVFLFPPEGYLGITFDVTFWFLPVVTELTWHGMQVYTRQILVEVDNFLHIFSFSLHACGFVVWYGTRGTLGLGWPRFLVWGVLAACCEVQRSIHIQLMVLEIFLIPSWHHSKEEEKRRGDMFYAQITQELNQPIPSSGER